MSEIPTTPITGAPKASALMPFGAQGIQLQSVEQALVFAKAVIDSGMCPPHFKNPQAVLVAIQAGAEIGLGPFASLQSFAVINNRPTLFGDSGKAILRANGFDIEEEMKGDTAVCTVTHPRQKPVTRTFSIADARQAGLLDKAGPWKQYPRRQLAWRAFWFAARDAAADVLKGAAGAEEIRDLPAEPRNVTPPAAAQTLAALDAPKDSPAAAPDDTHQAGVGPSTTGPAGELPFDGDEQTRLDIEASKARA